MKTSAITKAVARGWPAATEAARRLVRPPGLERLTAARMLAVSVAVFRPGSRMGWDYYAARVDTYHATHDTVATLWITDLVAFETLLRNRTFNLARTERTLALLAPLWTERLLEGA